MKISNCMTTLISAGDSFTWGSDLPDCTPGYASRLSWAAFTAQQLGYNYKCLAKPGSGNSGIARRLITGLAKLDTRDTIVVVMWTFPVRMEIAINKYSFTQNPNLFTDDDENFFTVSTWHSMTEEESLSNVNNIDRISFFKKQFKGIKDIGIHDYARSLISLADSDHYIIESLKSILLIQLYLEANNIKYAFCSSTRKILEARNSNNNFVHVIANQINWDKWATEKGFYEWAKNNNYKILEMQHPDQSAHINYASQYIIPFIKPIMSVAA